MASNERKAKQVRTYFWRPCNARHQAPTNAKCQRNDDTDNRPTSPEPPTHESPEKQPPWQGTGARPKTRTRTTPQPQAGTSQGTRTSGKRRRVDYQGSLEPTQSNSPNDNDANNSDGIP